MVMDVEVNYTLLERIAEAARVDLDKMSDAATPRAALLETVIRNLRRTAREAVSESGLRWAGDDVDTTGEWPRFQARFQGDADGALAAWTLLCDAVAELDGIRILMASVRGSDGTNFQFVDEEYERELEAFFESLPQETQDRIDALMTPSDQVRADSGSPSLV